MYEKNNKSHEMESYFNIDQVSFENVSKEFENKFKKRYESSLNRISDSKDRLSNASGANTLDILEKMASRLSEFDKNADFNESYHALEKEYEPFTET